MLYGFRLHIHSLLRGLLYLCSGLRQGTALRRRRSLRSRRVAIEVEGDDGDDAKGDVLLWRERRRTSWGPRPAIQARLPLDLGDGGLRYSLLDSPARETDSF